MKKKAMLAVFCLLMIGQGVSGQNPCPSFDWAVKGGGSGYEEGKFAADPEGNSYVTGYFSGNVSFGNIVLSAPSTALFVAKLDPQGKYLWAVKAEGNVSGNAIAADDDGHVYITGGFSGNVSFGDTVLNSFSSSTDVFVARLNTQGQWIWAVKGGGGNVDLGTAITTDKSGNCYVTGYYTSSATFGKNTLTSAGQQDVFISRLDPQGQWLWSRSGGGTDIEQSTSISADISGNVYVTGNFKDKSTFAGVTMYSSGAEDIFIVKLSAEGQWAWARRAGGTGPDESASIATDTNGNCYITGNFFITATFGAHLLTAEGQQDIFVAKIDSQGLWVWAKKAGSSNYDVGTSLFTDPSGNTCITGRYGGNASFGNIFLTGGNGSFFAKMDTDGIWQLAIKTDLVSPNFVFSDHEGNSYLAGHFYGSISPGGIDLSSSGDQDIFVSKLRDGYLSIDPISDQNIICGKSIRLPASVKNYSSLQWSPPEGLSNPNIPDPIAAPTQTTSYTLTATNACGHKESKTLLVSVTSFSLHATADNSTISCGSSTRLHADIEENVTDAAYTWSPALGLDNPNSPHPAATPPLTTTYTVTARTPHGCTNTANVTITVNNPNPPAVNITSNTGGFKLCSGGLTLSASGFVSYFWSDGSTTASISVTRPGWYSLIAIDASGCAGSDSVEITPLTVIHTPQGTVLCPGQASQSVQLAADGGMDSYLWSNGAQTQSIQVSQPGNYSVTVNKGSCSYTASVQVTMSSGQASADFSHTANGLSVDFKVISPSINFLSWNFGDGNTSFEQDPTHTYAKPGNYEVTVAVTDFCGNNAEKTKSVSVSGQVGVKTIPEGSYFQVYPNPAWNKVWIRLLSQRPAPFHCEVLTLQGQSVKHQIFFPDGETIELDMRSLPEGIYLLRLEQGEDRQVQRFIKTH
jgi:hypothetical protein